MNAVARLLAFGALLAVVFAAAAFAGGAADVERGGDAAAPHGAMAGAATHEESYAVRLEDGGLRVVDADGETVQDFDVAHERELHVIQVRRDLSGFRHLHPTPRPDGSWAVDLEPSRPGSYRVFADFEVGGEKFTPSADLQVDGDVRSRPLPAPVQHDAVDGLDVALAQDGDRFAFYVSDEEGRPVEVEDYLGAKGHLVALRASDLEYAHVHAEEDELAFEAELPSAGRYRLYLQFADQGRVHTAEFTIDAS